MESVSRKCVLVLFTRYPKPGVTKTRLIPALGAEGAAELQRAMTEHALEIAPPTASVMIEVRHAGGDAQRMRAWLGGSCAYADQGEGDLGARMARAFTHHFDADREKVVLIGSDCPDIDSGTSEAAFTALDASDVVIGPARDGGYYLIGLHARVRPWVARLFADTDWGTEHARETTVARANALGLHVAELGMKTDVDTPEDLQGWGEAVRRTRISVVIPAFNEAECIEETIARAGTARNVEVIVVDGGSNDGTPAIATRCGARLVVAPRGRAHQMNAGAAAAEGGILLFLHADTLLPEHWATQVRRHLALPDVALGAFRFTLDAPGWKYRYVEWTAGLRCRWLRMPYGDQGLFLRRTTFEEAGGFPELPVMEDYALVRTLRRQGRVVTLDAPVITAARRWQRNGVFNTTARNIGACLAYPLGLAPERIAKWLGRE